MGAELPETGREIQGGPWPQRRAGDGSDGDA
jgi:hypothetical protein